MTALGHTAVALLGLAVGSVLTMVIDRVPDRLPVLRPGPRCPWCEQQIEPRDLVPVVSWFLLRGHCRACDHRITPAYPAVEVITALLFLAGSLRFGFEPVLVPFLVLFAALVALSVVDLYRYRIPDRILFPALGLSLVLIGIVSVAEDVPEQILRALVGAAVYSFILLIFHLISPRGMGFGDVKLALLMGLFLGWPYAQFMIGLRLVFYAVLLGAMLGVASGIGLGLLRRMVGREVLVDPDHAGTDADGRAVGVLRQSVPFGPALATACIVVVLFSQQLAV